ncbi:MAG TPA: hypothetical protein VMM60_05735 [Ilumatobacter sp.]|nr:hypothetical protein [Ilumatobacter sp.]
MTGNDHTDAPRGDVVTGALREPAHPFELAHEDAVIAAMADALTTAPEPLPVRRPRRVAAFAAVTIASLGVGGIIAAGPGRLDPFSNNDSPATTLLDQPAPTDDEEDEDGDGDGGTDRITDDPNVVCAEGNHGKTVSSVTEAGGDTNAAAHSDCGKPVGSGSGTGDDPDANTTLGGVDRITTDPNVECAEGNHGKTVSSVAEAGGDTNAAAQSDCGMPVTSKGRNGNGNAGTNNGNPDPGPPAGTPGNPDPGQPESTPNDPDPGPPASTPGDPEPGPPAGTPNNGNSGGNNADNSTATTQLAG